MATETLTMTRAAAKGESESPESTQGVVYAPINFYSGNTPPTPDDLNMTQGYSPNVSAVTVPITDLRSLPAPLSSYHHEKHGFQILRQPLPIKGELEAFRDPHLMHSKYYPSLVSLMKKEFGVRSAVVLERTVRCVTPFDPRDEANAHLRSKITITPYFIAHQDYLPSSGRAHLRAMTPDFFQATGTAEGVSDEEQAEFFRLRDEIFAEEDKAMEEAGLEPGNGDPLTGKGGHWEWDGRGYKGPRYTMFSVWRPLQTVQRDPLTVCEIGDDFAHVLVERMYDRPGFHDYYGQNMLLTPPPTGQEEKYKWRYIGDQKPDEVIALKFYDSETFSGDGSIKCFCPHTAFKLPGSDHAPSRMSCETRVYCIY